MAYGKIKLWREPDENGDFADLTEKQKLRLTDRAFNYCTWSLGKSAKTEKQLTDKMRQKNCPEDIIELTIQRLSSYNYVNDEDFTTNFINTRRSMGWGDRKITMELSKRGIDQELSASTLEKLVEDEDDYDNEYSRAERFAEKKLRSVNKSLDKQKRVSRTVGAMVRKGFPMGICFEIVNRLIQAEELEG